MCTIVFPEVLTKKLILVDLVNTLHTDFNCDFPHPRDAPLYGGHKMDFIRQMDLIRENRCDLRDRKSYFDICF